MPESRSPTSNGLQQNARKQIQLANHNRVAGCLIFQNRPRLVIAANTPDKYGIAKFVFCF